MFHRVPLASLGVLGLASLFAGCQYFSNVVVPATDTTPPSAISGVYDVSGGDYVRLGFNDNFVYQVTDPTMTYLAVGATLDNGGAKSVTITGAIQIDCHNNDHIGETTTEDLAPMTATQAGGAVGSTVSNGVWTYYVVRFDQIAGCDPGFTLDDATFGWSTVSEDFHGNVSYGSGALEYRP